MKRISDSDLLSYHRGDMDQGTTRQIMASELILARRVIEAARQIKHTIEANEHHYKTNAIRSIMCASHQCLSGPLKAYDEGVK